VGELRALFRLLNARQALEHRRRTLLTIAGVAAGVALLFSTSAINTTLRKSIDASIAGLGGDAQVEVSAAGATGLPAGSADLMGAIPGVEATVPVVREVAELGGPGGSARALVLGVTPEFGRLFDSGAGPLGDLRGGLRLSPALADALGASAGRRLRIETPRGDQMLRMSGRVGEVDFSGVNGGRFALTDLDTADTLFSRGGSVDSIYLLTAEAARHETIERAAQSRLRGAAVVGDPADRAAPYERTFDSLSQLSSLASSAAMLVALFVVFNSMSITVLERRRTLAMALAVGASRRAVAAAFLLEAVALGAIGAVLGVGLGWLLGHGLVERVAEDYPLLPITAGGSLRPGAGDVLAAVLGGIAVGALGAFAPVRRIARLSPAEAMQPLPTLELKPRRERRVAWRLGLLGAGALAAGLAAVGVYSFLADDQAWIGTSALLLTLSGVMLLLPVVVPPSVRALRPVLSWQFAALGRLSADSLIRNPGRTSLTVGGLAVAAGMAIAIGTAIGSFRSEVREAADLWYGAPLYVNADSYRGITSDQPLPRAVQRDVARVEGVRAVYPWRYAMLNWQRRQTVLYALPLAKAARDGLSSPMSSTVGVEPRKLIAGLARGDVVISRYTARTRDLDAGDSLVLSTPRGARSFRVAAIFDDLISLDSMYIEYSRYARLWMDDRVDRLAIVPAPGVDDELLRDRLTAFLERRDIPAEALTKEALIGNVLHTIDGAFSLARGIQSAALLIAALIVANTMFTVAVERRWEFALARALGMKAGELRKSMLIEGSTLGLLGAAFAVLLGLAIGYLMLRSMELRFDWEVGYRPPWLTLAAVVAAGSLLAAAASVPPTRLATRAEISEALREAT
jgi:putative ABC transport system permease protein